MDLLKQQDELQKEANNVLKRIALIEFLSKFGTPTIVGSLASGLMVWRDIDIELIKQINEDEYFETVKFLLHNKEIGHKFSLKDFRETTNPATPPGLYIEIKVTENGNDWKIDLWFLDPREGQAVNYNQWIKKKINNETKKIILEIKNQIYSNPKYRKSIFSVDLYKAVIEESVKDLDGFNKYLAKSGRTLE